jgi:hypothetical protein
MFVDSVLSTFFSKCLVNEIEIRLNSAQNYPIISTLFLCMKLMLMHYMKATFPVLNFY